MPENTTRPPPLPKPIGKVQIRKTDLRVDGAQHLDSPELVAEIEREQRRTQQAVALLEATKAELARAEQRASRLPPESSEPPPAHAHKGKPERAPTFKEWQILAFKIGGGLVAVLGAVTTYLSVHSATVLPPKLENAEARTKVVETTTSDDHTALLALRDYVRASRLHDRCVIGQLGAALLVSTGRSLPVIPIPETDLKWKQQFKPPARAPLVWDTWGWQSETTCPPDPSPP